MNVDKVMFLDIDGCLTSEIDGNYFNPDPAKYHPSKKIVDRILNFCEKEDVSIVISSNWRKFDIDGYWNNSYGTYRNPLTEVKDLLKKFCIGTLPPDRHITKAKALIKWLNETSYDGNFVIFDDDAREGYQTTDDFGIKNKFVSIDSRFGITEKDLKEAKEILRNNGINY